MSRKPRPCGRCPKRNAHGVCLHLGQWISSLHASCSYGRYLMDNEYSAEYMRKRHGFKKRTPQPYRPDTGSAASAPSLATKESPK